jgi:hypothetical protein
MTTKPRQHDIDDAGKRILRDALEPLGWIANEVQKDYGIDFSVQVFNGISPNGMWFHLQLTFYFFCFFRPLVMVHIDSSSVKSLTLSFFPASLVWSPIIRAALSCAC